MKDQLKTLRSGYWRTGDGEMVLLATMDSNHISNVVNLLRKRLGKLDESVAAIGRAMTETPASAARKLQALQTLVQEQSELTEAINVFLDLAANQNAMDKDADRARNQELLVALPGADVSLDEAE